MNRPRQLWLHGSMRGKRAGSQDHLWDEDEIRSRTGKHGRREIRRGLRRQQRKR